MSMAMMVAMASRKRDERGRYMEGDNDRRMDGNYSRMDDEPEMRRRRDSRGRYMEDDGGNRMAYEGNRGRMEHDENDMHYRPWPEPHIPPYLDYPDMRDQRNIQPGRERRNGMQMAEGGYYPMRDRNIVHIKDYQDRRIGFGANRMNGSGNEESENEYRHGGASMHKSEYPIMDRLTEEMATSWVEDMQNADPDHPVGPKWTREEIKPIAIKQGFDATEKQIEFWAIMNMMYSDYANVARKHGVSKTDFFADMAKAWMQDKDAVEYKTAAYIACCTK